MGVAAFASAASLAVFFVVGGSFGTINDLGNGLVGIMSAVLVWAIRPRWSDASSGTAAISVLYPAWAIWLGRVTFTLPVEAAGRPR